MDKVQPDVITSQTWAYKTWNIRKLNIQYKKKKFCWSYFNSHYHSISINSSSRERPGRQSMKKIIVVHLTSDKVITAQVSTIYKPWRLWRVIELIVFKISWNQNSYYILAVTTLPVWTLKLSINRRVRKIITKIAHDQIRFHISSWLQVNLQLSLAALARFASTWSTYERNNGLIQ